MIWSGSSPWQSLVPAASVSGTSRRNPENPTKKAPAPMAKRRVVRRPTAFAKRSKRSFSIDLLPA
jgi:hypothetical protein